MNRLIGCIWFSDSSRSKEFEAPLKDASSWLGSCMRIPVTTEVVMGERYQIHVLGDSNPDISSSSRGVVAVDAGPVFLEGHDRSTQFASCLAKSESSEVDRILRATRGDFAGAMFVEHEDKLLLFRDHFGSRPLFYFLGDGYVAFSSHPAALLYFPGCSRRGNRRYAALVAASHYRTFDNAPEESPFRDIRQVPARSVVCINKGSVTSRRYWDLSDATEVITNESLAAGEYRRLLLQAVQRRLSGTQNNAFTLSGGMDSSSVLSCAVHLLGKKQEAYSCVYKDRTYDETDDIATITDEMVSTWNTVMVDIPNVTELVDQMVVLHGDVVATATWLSHFVLMQNAARKGVRFLFGGLGGDELNAGEYEHFFPFFADIQASGAADILDTEIAAWARHHDHPIFKKDKRVALETIARTTDSTTPGRCLPDMLRMRAYERTLRKEWYDLSSFEPQMDHPFASYLHNRSYQDLYRETTPCCLRAQDRHGVAFGITHVNPFLDVDLVEFMFRVSPRLKIRNGVTKFVLREAVKGILPEATRTRIAKTGWNAPAHVWFSGAGLERIRNLVRSDSFCLADIYRRDEVEAVIADHEKIVGSGELRPNHMMFIWQLVNLEAWARQFNVAW